MAEGAKSIMSMQAKMLGEQYVLEILPAAETKDQPVFLLLHGFPAWSTKNYDIAETLALDGFFSVVAHHIGLGLSQGQFSFKRSVEETAALIAQVRSVNPGRPVTVVGHSWGGFLALALAELADDVVVLAPLTRVPKGQDLWNLVDGLFEESPQECSVYTRESLFAEFEELATAYPFDSMVAKCKDKRVMVIHGTRDPVLPVKNSSEFVAALGSNVTYLELDDLHLLVGHRRRLLQELRRWVAQ